MLRLTQLWKFPDFSSSCFACRIFNGFGLTRSLLSQSVEVRVEFNVESISDLDFITERRSTPSSFNNLKSPVNNFVRDIAECLPSGFSIGILNTPSAIFTCESTPNLFGFKYSSLGLLTSLSNETVLIEKLFDSFKSVFLIKTCSAGDWSLRMFLFFKVKVSELVSLLLTYVVPSFCGKRFNFVINCLVFFCGDVIRSVFISVIFVTIVELKIFLIIFLLHEQLFILSSSDLFSFSSKFEFSTIVSSSEKIVFGILSLDSTVPGFFIFDASFKSDVSSSFDSNIDTVVEELLIIGILESDLYFDVDDTTKGTIVALENKRCLFSSVSGDVEILNNLKLVALVSVNDWFEKKLLQRYQLLQVVVWLHLLIIPRYALPSAYSYSIIAVRQTPVIRQLFISIHLKFDFLFILDQKQTTRSLSIVLVKFQKTCLKGFHFHIVTIMEASNKLLQFILAVKTRKKSYSTYGSKRSIYTINDHTSMINQSKLTTMYFPRIVVVNLTLLSDRIFLYIENKLSTSIEVIVAYFIKGVSNYNTKS
ncbi:hypothetical protein AGLY_016124 [Aphis glycines]|uniref:Uncharacterized protein n=1 Tax=Aphis glycines TaxID=307491 RepID=A0A6G0SZ89_APHGL|nr:hypothetical protein AGLY_016124 [Aphis glycines]